MIDQATGLRALAARSEGATRLAAAAFSGARTRAQGRCTTLAVTSGKGGVGKTNVSINLAMILAHYKKRVILFDADLGLANIHLLLGMNPAFTLNDAVEGRVPLRELVVPGPGGIFVIPAGNGFEKMANLDGAALNRLMGELSALEESCDYLIFDTGAGISRTVRAFVASAHTPLVVVTPEPSSLADAYAAVKMAVRAGCGEVSVIANRVRDDQEGRETFEKLSALCAKFLGHTPIFLGALPYDKNLETAVRRQAPLFLTTPRSPFTLGLARAALRLLGRPERAKPGFFNRLLELIGKD